MKRIKSESKTWTKSASNLRLLNHRIHNLIRLQFLRTHSGIFLFVLQSLIDLCVFSFRKSLIYSMSSKAVGASPLKLPYLLAECLAFDVPSAIPIPFVDPFRFAMHVRPPGAAPDLTIYPNVPVCGRFVFSLQIVAGKQTRLEIHLTKCLLMSRWLRIEFHF